MALQMLSADGEPLRLACVSGRFQPLHRQHLELFDRALQEADHLIVAITNPDAGALYASPASSHRHRPQDNPFSYFDRCRFVAAALRQLGALERATIVPFDLGAPEHWTSYVPLTALQWVRVYSSWEATKVQMLEAAGYAVRAVPGDAGNRVSSSTIRARMRTGEDWEDDISKAVVPLLRAHITRAQATAAPGAVP